MDHLGYLAPALGLLGLLVGFRFKFKVLAALMLVTFSGAIIYAIIGLNTFLQTVLEVLATQSALQFGYFVGALLQQYLNRNGTTRSL